MKRQIQESKGFSLIEILMVIGLMSITGLAIATLMNRSFKDAKQFETRISATQLHNEIYQTLNNIESCRSSFGPAPGGSDVTLAEFIGPTYERNQPFIKNSDGTAILYQTGNVYFNNSVKIETMKLTEFLLDGTVSQRTKALVSLKVKYTRILQNTIEIPEQHIRLQLIFYTAAAGDAANVGKIRDCYVLNGSSNYDSIWSRNPTINQNIYYNAGKVGVGITDPTFNLHVSSTINGKQLAIDNGLGSVQMSQLSFNANGVTQSFIAQNTSSNYLIIAGEGANASFDSIRLRPNSAATDAMIIKRDGKIGVNTLTPTALLQIDALAGTTTFTAGSAGQKVTINNPGGVASLLGFDPATSNYNHLAIRANASPQLFLSSTNGFVGVGNTAPQTMLDVSGAIKPGSEGQSGACGGGTRGSLRYNSGGDKMEYCSATGWKAVGFKLEKINCTWTAFFRVESGNSPQSAPNGCYIASIDYQATTGGNDGLLRFEYCCP